MILYLIKDLYKSIFSYLLFNFISFTDDFLNSIGDTRLGLMRTCLTLHNRPQQCYNSELNSSWLFTLIAIFAGCICLTITIVLMIVSHWDRTVAPYAKWIGFSAGNFPFKNCFERNGSKILYDYQFRKYYNIYFIYFSVILFCLASIVFPIGFSVDEIGGAPYQLPNSSQVGLSYIFFVMALWITVISELFASKVCLPHF